jgi:hypothetical protein
MFGRTTGYLLVLSLVLNSRTSSDEEESDNDVEQNAVMEQAEVMMSESDGEAMDMMVVKAEVVDPPPLRRVTRRRSSLKK